MPAPVDEPSPPPRNEGLSADILPVAGCPSCARVVLSGYLDLHTIPAFQDAMSAALGESTERLILDCQGTSFISASGIGALLTLSKTMAERSGELILAGIPEKSFGMFRLLGFSEYFVRAHSSLAAIEYVRTTSLRGFPQARTCPSCGTALLAPAPGTYRCEACGSDIVVETAETGQTSPSNDIYIRGGIT
jgi:anti-anti-sigma factor